MKRLLSLVMVLVVSLSLVSVAQAKKFGGGSSFGKSFKTAPAPKHNTEALKQKGAQTPQASKNGLMGGLLGGLLAGGLLAAFFGGAFEGVQFLDILIVGLIAFILFRFLRGVLAAKQVSLNGHQSAYQHAGQAHYRQAHDVEENTWNQGGFGASAASDVPHRYPDGFDPAAFINGAREHYRVLQGAWNHNELETIREYVSPSLFDDLIAERQKLEGEQHTDVMYVDAEIVRADYDANHAQLSLQFTGRYRDAVEGIEEPIDEIWHLERQFATADAPWLIIGIQNR